MGCVCTCSCPRRERISAPPSVETDPAVRSVPSEAAEASPNWELMEEVSRAGREQQRRRYFAAMCRASAIGHGTDPSH